MARTRKSIQPLNLYKYDVLIDDTATRSDYFKISQFDGYFYGGRNAFLIAGAGVGVFRPGTKVLVEILNKNGTTVYSAPITSFIEGSSRLIQVEVYSDTPIGTGKIVILGCAQTYIDGTPIPDEWKDKFNVRWSADVIISPLIENKTPIRFAKAPSIVVDEKFYSTPSSSTFIKQINVPVDISITPKYFNVFPNGYLVKLNGPSDTRYFSPYLDGTITGSITIKNSTFSETASISLPLTNIFNKNLAESEGSLLYTNNKTLILEGAFSSSGSYLTNISPFGDCQVTGSINIQYNQLDTVATGSSISFAKIRLIDLSTLSGEIHKIRVSYKPTTEPGEYVLLGDVNTTVQELLAVDSGSRIAPTGNFRNVVINDYWHSATMSLEKNEYNPTIPVYYNSSSLVNTGSFLTQCCVDLLDSINATPPIVGGDFINGVSYFIGTRKSNTAVLFPRSEYTLAFNAVVTRTSQSIELSQSDYSMEVYLVPEETTNGKLLETNPLGQLLGVLTPAQKFTKQNFETVEFNFKPKINESGNFGLRFVVYGGYWNIANVSMKIAQEPFFSPDEIDILIPNVNYTNKILTFKSEYLDVNNNSIGFSTLSLPTYFTGSESSTVGGSSVSASYAVTSSYSTYAQSALSASWAPSAEGVTVAWTSITGKPTVVSQSAQINTGSFTGSFIGTHSGSTFGTSSWAISASVSTTSSNLTGGATNYIPLWTSATAQSSSNIYQSSGNIGIGNTSPVAVLDAISSASGIIRVRGGNGTNQGGAFYVAKSDGLSTLAAFGDTARITGGTPDAGVTMYAGGTVPLSFYVNSNIRATIDIFGNMGIGNTSPDTNLSVVKSSGGLPASTGTTPTTAITRIKASANNAMFMGMDTASPYSGWIQVSDITGLGTTYPLILNPNGGNVGIGTSNPGVTLDVASGVSRFGGSGGVHTGIAAGFLVGQAELYTVGAAPLGIGTTGTQPLRLYTGGSLRATLDTSGNLGLGTTSPANSSKLDVADGKIRAGTVTSTNGSTIIEGAYSNGAITTLGTEYSSGGPVLGYGVTPSTASADSFFSSTGINANRGAYVMAGGVHKWSSATASSAVTIGTAVSLTETMRLTMAGNLGIGTTSPAYKLDVSGSIGLSGFLFALKSGNYTQIYEPAGNTAIYLGNATDPSNYYDNTAHWWRTRGGGTVNMYLNSVGLGLGTFSPASKLHLSGSSISAFADYGALTLEVAGTSGLTFGYDTTNNYSWIYSRTSGFAGRPININSNLYVQAFSTGKVGIGTTLPGNKLTVSGSVDATGSLAVLVNPTANYQLKLTDTSGVGTGFSQVDGGAYLFLNAATNIQAQTHFYPSATDTLTLGAPARVWSAAYATYMSASVYSGSTVHTNDLLGKQLIQTSGSINTGDYFYDTGVTIGTLIPTGPAIYELLAQYNPNTAGSINYRNIIHGNIYIVNGYDGSQVVATVQYNELFKAISSGSYDGAGSNVNVSFVNATNALPATERITIPFASSSWQLRIRFSDNSTPPAAVDYRSVRLLRKL